MFLKLDEIIQIFDIAGKEGKLLHFIYGSTLNACL